MLSYMLSVDEKPPSGPGKGHLQLAFSSEPLTNGRTPISKENSVSSFASDATTATASHSSITPTSISDKVKPKLLINGAKHQTLKRVSFGSSKGSMVETLIFESPLQEEPEPSPILENPTPFPEDHDQTEDEREKVRVSFFQQSKPQEVDLPDEPVIYPDSTFIMATTINDPNHIPYNRQESTDSGWDNPFRPGGDLSREADEIVELIKGGKPITPTSGGTASPIPSFDQADAKIDQNNTSKSPPPTEPITESPKKIINDLHATPKNATNGNIQNDAKAGDGGTVDVQRGTILPQTPADANQVEHVVIKKKPKCKCCVIQ